MTLSLYRLTEGLTQARRIIRDANGYSHAGECIPFAAEFKRDALLALDELESQARLWRISHEFAKWRERQKADYLTLEREVQLNETGQVA